MVLVYVAAARSTKEEDTREKSERTAYVQERQKEIEKESKGTR
jgi:hypothetical protein